MCTSFTTLTPFTLCWRYDHFFLSFFLSLSLPLPHSNHTTSIRIRPNLPPRPHQPLQPHIRRINRTNPRKQKHIIQPPPKNTTKKWRHHRYPEVIASRGPDLVTITQEVGHQSRTKVPSEIDCVARLPSETGTNAEDDEEKGQWCEVAGAEVTVVFEGVDAEHEDGGGDEFGEELTGFGHEGGWVGAEDSRGGGVAVSWDGAELAAAFVDVDGGFVVGVDDPGGAHGAEDLGEHVGGEFAPGEAAEDAV